MWLHLRFVWDMSSVFHGCFDNSPIFWLFFIVLLLRLKSHYFHTLTWLQFASLQSSRYKAQVHIFFRNIKNHSMMKKSFYGEMTSKQEFHKLKVSIIKLFNSNMKLHGEIIPYKNLWKKIIGSCNMWICDITSLNVLILYSLLFSLNVPFDFSHMSRQHFNL